MSKRFDIQDATTILVHKPGVGSLAIVSNTTPTDSVAGFAPSCTWQNTAGAAATCFYVNVGTNTSSNWLNLA